MAFLRPALASAALVAASLLASVASAQSGPRILGSSVGVEAKSFDARVVVTNDPSGKVAKGFIRPRAALRR
jgi:hypothetical protein